MIWPLIVLILLGRFFFFFCLFSYSAFLKKFFLVISWVLTFLGLQRIFSLEWSYLPRFFDPSISLMSICLDSKVERPEVLGQGGHLGNSWIIGPYISKEFPRRKHQPLVSMKCGWPWLGYLCPLSHKLGFWLYASGPMFSNHRVEDSRAWSSSFSWKYTQRREVMTAWELWHF